VRRVAVSLMAIALSSCGYHVGGHSDLLPQTIKTIAVPAFTNATTRYKLTDRLAESITREFNSRTRYRVVSDPNGADAVLRGSVTNYVSFATIIDPNTNRASAVDLRVYLQISLVDRTGRVIFSRPNMEVRERYEISVNAGPYFEESDAALDRVSKQVGQQVVSSILENF
jgi:Lipopolysaccharide-assembly